MTDESARTAQRRSGPAGALLRTQVVPQPNASYQQLPNLAK